MEISRIINENFPALSTSTLGRQCDVHVDDGEKRGITVKSSGEIKFNGIINGDCRSGNCSDCSTNFSECLFYAMAEKHLERDHF